jgi:PHS family inorganic phosphate transporter-like MFS transporter
MTGKQLNDEQRALLARMFQVKSLKNADISFILNISMKTVQRRRIEYEQTGNLRKHRDVSKNAEKLKPEHLQV